MVYGDTGSDTITAGNTYVDVTHTLGSVPAVADISWTSDSGGKRWWITNKTSSNFRLNIDSIYSANITFDWGVA